MDEVTRALPADGPLLLGRYRLGPVIGRGGMSTVYRGEDAQLGRAVAIKILAPHLSGDPQFRRRLLAEAQAAARLPHPHIVQVFDVGTVAEPGAAEARVPGVVGAADAADAVVLVLELVEGESLRRRLDAGPLPVEEAVEIAAQVAEALAYAHERGIVHRDVKPHNILLAAAAPGGAAGGAGVWAKLADFGIARSVDATSTLTATGLLLGSAPYIAPELLEGRPAGIGADVYALGVTLFQMLTGRLPFEGGATAVGLTQRLTVDAPRVGAVGRDVPAWLDGLVARALARRPEERVADAGTLARLLRDPHGATTQLLRQAPAVAAADADDATRLLTRAAPPRPAREGERLPAVPPRRVLLGAGAVAVAGLTIAAVFLAGAGGVTQRGPAGTAMPTAATGATAAPGGAEAPTPTAIAIRPR